MNTQGMREQGSLTAALEKASVVWTDAESSHHLPISQSKALAPTDSTQAERGEDAAERSVKLAEVGSRGFREEAVSRT